MTTARRFNRRSLGEEPPHRSSMVLCSHGRLNEDAGMAAEEKLLPGVGLYEGLLRAWKWASAKCANRHSLLVISGLL